MTREAGAERRVTEHFDGDRLDTSVWLPHYLPAWSSRAATAASYEVRDSCLHLRIPPGHPLWLPGEHEPPLRVSGLQSGNVSGPVGGTRGQQPPFAGALVREEQPGFWGWTPRFGHLELRARMVLNPTSMAAWWMVGREIDPRESAEICVVEVFGRSVDPGRSAEVGTGLHQFRDPRVPEDFSAPRLELDVAEFHTYAVDWSADRVTFLVDDRPIRSCPSPPTYPLQHMLAVFDFPATRDDTDQLRDAPVGAAPELVVDYLTVEPARDGGAA
ncbi:MAG: glycoside hydrolase family 16 protein [Actinomycetales bacterium]|nr:glycoside hydrolase family 16 protein [Actinomycetales bacterium]